MSLKTWFESEVNMLRERVHAKLSSVSDAPEVSELKDKLHGAVNTLAEDGKVIAGEMETKLTGAVETAVAEGEADVKAEVSSAAPTPTGTETTATTEPPTGPAPAAPSAEGKDAPTGK